MKENQNSTAVEGLKMSTKTVTKIEQHPTALPKRLRVAAYARATMLYLKILNILMKKEMNIGMPEN